MTNKTTYTTPLTEDFLLQSENGLCQASLNPGDIKVNPLDDWGSVDEL